MSEAAIYERCGRACPVCGGRRTKHLFSQRFECIGGVDLLDGYDVSVCRSCGAGYADNIPPQAAFDAYYRDLSKYEYQHRSGKESPYDELRFRAISGLVCRFIQSAASLILEIGCATGRLLALLKEAGCGYVTGLDPSAACAEAALKLYGVPVRVGTITNLPDPGIFDFLILVGVLEHIRDLDTTMARLHQMTSAAGRVYIEVPDGSRFASRPDAPFQEFSTEHINFFSPISLDNLMLGRGFRPIHIEQVTREQNAGALAPVICAIYEKFSGPVPPLTPDHETEKGIGQYIRDSQEADNRVREIIAHAIAARGSVIVWGAGAHTQRLLAVGFLPENGIAAFVDSNTKYHGRLLRGIPILSPDDLRSRTEPILISSRVFQKEIVDQVRKGMGLANDLITLYGDLG